MPKLTALTLAFFLLFSSTSVFAFQPVVSKTRNTNQTRLRICQARENTLRRRLEKILNMGDAMITNFDSKAQRVQNYYSDHLVPQNQTVANYGDLVTAVQTQKTEVQNFLSKARAEASSFDCDTDNPQKTLQDFRKYMQQSNNQFKSYRTSVRNLIVAVRSAAEGVQ